MKAHIRIHLDIQQPDDEQKEHHDRADVNDYLQEAQRYRVQTHEDDAEVHQHQRQREHAMDRVALHDHAEA